MSIDVVRHRERDRQRRLLRLTLLLAPIAAWLWFRLLTGRPLVSFPKLPPDAVFWLPGLVFILLLGLVLVLPLLGSGRSPHVIYLPEQIEVGFEDVRGMSNVVAEVRHTLETFLNHKRFRIEMGGVPRRGVLFEGPPGTGKTHLAKAMAKEAGVPFLFVSATAFQSMWYGATARKIRAYFRALRRTARREGGAIGFIEEIDAIGQRRGAVSATPLDHAVARSAVVPGAGGVVNELLVQLQSFDEPTPSQRVWNAAARTLNRFLPAHRRIPTRRPPFANVLLIGATNRADSLDPALLRPGRFDRILTFGLPGRADRRELVAYFLSRRSHDPELAAAPARDALAAATMGYTPASLERLFDEALMVALREGRRELTMRDLRRAQMEVEVGLPHPVDYTPADRRRIATHEAGHATVAYLAGKGRRLEVLSIVKRSDSLGLLSHRDTEERFTRTRGELRALLQIAMAGLAAEDLLLGEASTGPAGDLTAATRLAAEMVGAYGMGGSLVSLKGLDLGLVGGGFTARVLGDRDARERVERLLEEARREASRLLREHRHLLEALREALEEREELVADEIMDVIRAAEGRTLTDRVVVDLREPSSASETVPQRDEPEGVTTRNGPAG